MSMTKDRLEAILTVAYGHPITMVKQSHSPERWNTLGLIETLQGNRDYPGVVDGTLDDWVVAWQGRRTQVQKCLSQ